MNRYDKFLSELEQQILHVANHFQQDPEKLLKSIMSKPYIITDVDEEAIAYYHDYTGTGLGGDIDKAVLNSSHISGYTIASRAGDVTTFAMLSTIVS